MIVTERLQIQPVSINDAEFILTLLNSKSWIQNIGNRNVHTIEEAQKYIESRMLPQLKEKGYGNNIVQLRSTGETIGTAGIYHRPGLGIPDIGFAFLEEYQGKGYGSESAYHVMNMGFRDYDIPAMSAITLPSNKASVRLLEKLGMKYVKMIHLPDDEEELMYYEITKEEFLRKKF